MSFFLQGRVGYIETDSIIIDSTAFIRNHRDWYNVGDSKFSRMDPAKVESVRLFSRTTYRWT